jgi:hypothetical protein
MTIKAELRTKVIELAQQKKGRNEIAYELNFSQGSVSNILREWREGKDQTINAINSTISSILLDTDAGSPDSINQVHSGTGIAESPATNITSAKHQSSEPDIDFADIAYPESYPIELVEELKILQTQKEQLLIEIEEGRKMLDALKDEMSRCGIDPSMADSPRILNVIHAFRQYGYDPSKIMNAFTEVVEIEDARNDIERLRSEIESDRRILDEKLESLGLGNFDELRRVCVALLTLEQFNIGIDQIISIYQDFRNQQNQRSQNWINNGSNYVKVTTSTSIPFGEMGINEISARNLEGRTKFDECIHCRQIRDMGLADAAGRSQTTKHLRYLHEQNERLEKRLKSIT